MTYHKHFSTKIVNPTNMKKGLFTIVKFSYTSTAIQTMYNILIYDHVKLYTFVYESYTPGVDVGVSVVRCSYIVTIIWFRCCCTYKVAFL